MGGRGPGIISKYATRGFLSCDTPTSVCIKWFFLGSNRRGFLHFLRSETRQRPPPLGRPSKRLRHGAHSNLFSSPLLWGLVHIYIPIFMVLQLYGIPRRKRINSHIYISNDSTLKFSGFFFDQPLFSSSDEVVGFAALPVAKSLRRRRWWC